MFSSEHIKNKVLTITSELPCSEDHFEGKFQAKIYLSNQFFEQPEEELIEFKGEKNMKSNKFSLEHF